MTILARAAGMAAALAMVAAPRGEAQSSISVTIARGPHAGAYELQRGQCDALDGQVISMFTPKLAGVAEGPKVPESIELYTEPGRGRTDGFAVTVDFRAKSGERIVYEIYAIPPELQGPGGNKPPKGRGSVTIEKKETGTVATFRGETKDGVKMEGSVTCGKRP